MNFVEKQYRDERFTTRQRHVIVKANGYICPLSSKEFKTDDGEVDYQAFIVHHIHPLSNNGKSVKDNALVCSKKMDNQVHGLIDLFRRYHNVDYKFLTTVFVNLFAVNPTKEIKKRFNYREYAENLTSLADMFWFYLEEWDTGYENKAIFSLYYEYMLGETAFHPAMLVSLNIERSDAISVLRQAQKNARKKNKDYIASYLGTYEKYI